MSDLFDLNLSKDKMNKYSLNPASHLSEVDVKAYMNSRLFRSTIGTRCLDTFIFIAGAFHGEMFDETGGQAGILDFIIPHYFTYRLLSFITHLHFSTLMEILLIVPIILIGIVNFLLSVLQKTIAFGLFLLSVPSIFIVDAFCQSTYNERKNLIKDLMIFTNSPTELFPLQELINTNFEIDDTTDIFEPRVVLPDVGTVLSYKDIFSKLNATTGLFEEDGNLYIGVVRSESDKFIIPVDPANPEPLRSALYLNIFGITHSLEKSSQFDVSDLRYVENALSAAAGS